MMGEEEERNKILQGGSKLARTPPRMASQQPISSASTVEQSTSKRKLSEVSPTSELENPTSRPRCYSLPEIEPETAIRTTDNKPMARVMTELSMLYTLDRNTNVAKKREYIETLGRLQQIYEDIITENAALKEKLNILTTTPRQITTPTYSQVVTSAPAPSTRPVTKGPTEQRPKHTLFISQKGKTAKDVALTFTKIVNPVKDKIKIKRMVTTPRHVILETESHEDLERVVGNAALKKSGIVAEPPRKRNPLMIMYSVSTGLKEDELLEQIYQQNFPDIDEDTFKNEFKFKFRTGPRNLQTVHHVVEVSPRIRSLILKTGRIFAGFTSLSTKDYLVVARCHKCGDLGHISKYCKAGTEVCTHCGVQGHERSSCPGKNGPPTCIPCMLRKKRCVDRTKCPTYDMFLQRLIDKTNYGP